MSWQLLLVCYLVLGTAGYLLQRKLAVTLANYNRVVVGFFFVAVHYPLGLLCAAFSSPHLAIGWTNLALLLAGSGMFPLVTMLSFRANKDVDAGLYANLLNLSPVATIAVAYLLLHETLTNEQMFAAVVIIGSAFLATLPRLRDGRKSSSVGITIALIGIAVSGVSIVFERWMLTRMDFGAYLVYGWGAQTVWMVLLSQPTKKALKVLRKRRTFLPILSYSLTNTLRGLCFVAALKLSGNASVVSVFTSFMTVSVVLAAYVVLKEKKWLWAKIGAAVIGTIGLVILNLS